MKNLFLTTALLISLTATSQVTKVALQASGLTCSMCSNAINKALKTLDFIENIRTDIKHYTFELSFKPGATVDFNRIRSKVEGAGFSVSGFVATVNFNNITISQGEPVLVDNQRLQFMNYPGQLLNGARQVKVLDKGFVSAKEYRTNPVGTSPDDTGIYHVSL